jgi:glycerol-3-phosphate cytidylyltransferase
LARTGGKKPHNKGVEDYLKAQGKKVVQVQYNPRNSSTKIKKDVLSLHQTGKRV